MCNMCIIFSNDVSVAFWCKYFMVENYYVYSTLQNNQRKQTKYK